MVEKRYLVFRGFFLPGKKVPGWLENRHLGGKILADFELVSITISDSILFLSVKDSSPCFPYHDGSLSTLFSARQANPPIKTNISP
jgi:hypothetical protein